MQIVEYEYFFKNKKFVWQYIFMTIFSFLRLY